ncbi:hypothetical protein QH_0004 [Vibrio phage QH]|uniref:hypothetical protein n=1 Tax=Vibrio phage QH TaxID=1558469 RepID=UPI0005409665|nr:hypothetical protein ACQ41_gp04 [Vibrio phage QH]AIZ01355.1 hypothetical protein QH_0004 [Vibrio phage QH]
MENSKIVKRLDFLKTDRKNVEQIWDCIRKYIMPMRSDFFSDLRSEGSINWNQNREVFDSTAGDGLETLSSSLHGSLTSPATKWFELAFRDKELNSDDECRKWLENATHDVYSALQDSNFNLEANETYIDLCGYGNAIMVEEEDEDEEGSVVFQSSPIQDSYFEEDSRGQVVNFYRVFRWTPAQIYDRFGDEGTPEAIIKKAKEASNQAALKQEVVMCVFTRYDKKQNRNAGTILAPTERPFGKKWILKEGAVQLGEEGGYYEMPAYAIRWRKSAGSQWGFGPSHLALPDVLTANRYVELVLRSSEKVIDPAIMVTERGLISDIDLGASGLTVVRDMESMKPFESRARFDVSSIQLTDLRSAVRRIYYVDQLQMKDSPAMTATEVQVRYELMQRLLGPTLGRLENDFLSPMIQRTFNIRFRAGKLGELPSKLLESGKAAMDIVYTGPLSRAQKIDQAASIERWAGSTAQLAEINPEVLDIPDWDEMVRMLGSLLGAPQTLMRPKAKVTSIRKNRSQTQQKAEQAAIAEAEGNAMEAQGKGQAALKENQ